MEKELREYKTFMDTSKMTKNTVPLSRRNKIWKKMTLCDFNRFSFLYTVNGISVTISKKQAKVRTAWPHRRSFVRALSLTPRSLSINTNPIRPFFLPWGISQIPPGKYFYFEGLEVKGIVFQMFSFLTEKSTIKSEKWKGNQGSHLTEFL